MRTKKVIDFSKLIAQSTENFVGRQWVRDAVDDFLKADCPRYFLLLGEPGSGKTSFMADLIQRWGHPHHFIGKGCQIDLKEYSSDWHNPVRFAESVGYQLVCDYGGWIMSWEDWGISVEQEVKELNGLLMGAKVEEFKATPRPFDKPKLTVEQKVRRFGPVAEVVGVYIEKLKMDVEQIVYQLLKTPLLNVAEKYPEHQVVIIVDGLDEAESYSNNKINIFKMLPNGELPNNVRFLLSSRPGEHLETDNFLNHAQVFWLSEDEKGHRDPRTVEDAKAFIMKFAAEKLVYEMLKQKKLSPEILADRVANASQGNFLYLHHYTEGLRQGDETLLNLEELPRGLYDIYRIFLKKIKDRLMEAGCAEAYKPVLGLLAVAREALTQKQIADFSGTDREKVATVLMEIEQFLDSIGKLTEERRYAIYHKSFSEYLISGKNMDYIDGKKAHRRIVKFYQSGTESWKESYAMKYLLSHMIAAESWDGMEELLVNTEYLEKKQHNPAEQYRFQDDFIKLLKAEEIPTKKLVHVLERVVDAVTGQLEDGKQKADWLDTFAYWINEFGIKNKDKRSLALKELARKFDRACGNVTKVLAKKYLGEGENGWALRFAELSTWVYQRANDYHECIAACRHAEQMCLLEGMEEGYQYLCQPEFIRMRAQALRALAKQEADEGQKAKYETNAHEAYKLLNKVFSAEGAESWWPRIEEWKTLEKDTGDLPRPRSQRESVEHKTFRAKVVSNAHDCIGAIHIIRFFEKRGGLVEWIHPKKFKPEQFAPADTLFTVLIGSPKAPGVSDVAEKFYEGDNKERYLEMYSGLCFGAFRLKIVEGKTHCYMLGGVSKVNTLRAAYEFTEDPEVRETTCRQGQILTQ